MTKTERQDALIQPQINHMRYWINWQRAMTHTQIWQDDQDAQGESHGTMLRQSDPNGISSTLNHVGPANV